jgi:DNA-binding YbaB/EbfC family protein
MSQNKGFGFCLGKMKEIAQAIQKAQQVQEDAKKLQEELEKTEIEGQAGNGLVKVVMSGNQEPLRVEISAEALGEGAEVLSDLVFAAMKNAYTASTETMRQRMEALTANLQLPGM